MRKLIAIIALLFATSAAADPTASNGRGATVTLHSTPCVEPVVVKAVTPELLPTLRAFTMVLDGRDIPGCWVNDGGLIHMMDADGDVYAWPAADFGVHTF